jgi:hypothetical protein
MMKRTFYIFIMMCTAFQLAAQTSGFSLEQSNAIKGGIGLGTVLAVVLSWSRNRSVLWAILHGILGWLYVIYFILTRK